MDLTGVARTLVSKTFDVYEIYITAGLLYLVVTYGILGIFRTVERRWSGHLRTPPDEPRKPRNPLAGTATPMS
jgi:ABC-type arginine/histidine transport system permease subunit